MEYYSERHVQKSNETIKDEPITKRHLLIFPQNK